MTMEIKHKLQIKIINLGRNKFNGTFIYEGAMDEINQQILNECRKHLMSEDISFDKDTIFAGFRNVGKLETGEINK